MGSSDPTHSEMSLEVLASPEEMGNEQGSRPVPGQEDSTGAEALSWLEQGTSWSQHVKVSWLQCRGWGCARRVWGAVAGEWLRQGGREGGRAAPALLYNFVADAVITGRAPPAWPVDGRQPHTQPPLVPGTLSHPWHPLSLLGDGRSLLCTPGVWSASGCRVPIHHPARIALSLHPTTPPGSGTEEQCPIPAGMLLPRGAVLPPSPAVGFWRELGVQGSEAKPCQGAEQAVSKQDRTPDWNQRALCMKKPRAPFVNWK